MNLTPKKPTIESLIVANVPRDLLMAMEDALITGTQQGAQDAGTLCKGHIAHAVGQMRHFRMNEAFSDALNAADANPTPINGNRLVVGRIGIVSLARLNVSSHLWSNAKRSKARRQLAMLNRQIEQLVNPDLFDPCKPATVATVFAVAVFDRAVGNPLAELVRVDIAIPRADMDGWLYRQPVAKVIELYDVPATLTQPDNAIPVLKTSIELPKQQSKR